MPATIASNAVKAKKMLYRLFLGVAISILVINLGSGCGAMFNGSTSAVSINAVPPGSRVSVDGLYVANTPSVVTVLTAAPHSIDVEANGYERQTARIESRPSAGYIVLDCVLLLFLIVPGVIALVVDGATGDWRTLDTDHVDVRLNPAGPQPLFVAPVYPSFPSTQPQVPPTPAPTTVPSGCQYDAQCKGDRICRAGQCVAPVEGR